LQDLPKDRWLVRAAGRLNVAHAPTRAASTFVSTLGVEIGLDAARMSACATEKSGFFGGLLE
jgi:ABC-type Fe2+-enterobactin transport system substrate-binding protein